LARRAMSRVMHDEQMCFAFAPEAAGGFRLCPYTVAIGLAR
jgi:hypothetical protein